jgi:alginate O-acetyltransferase complex protein AlgI
MVFSSHIFLFYFLPAVLLGYYAAPRRWKHAFLTLLSYVFYGWANPAFVLLLLFSTLVDYISGLVIANHNPFGSNRDVSELDPGSPRSRAQRVALAASVVTNLSLLGFFKYFNFATENYDALVQAIGLPDLQLDLAMRITLPLGISFYTFQTMSYTIDVYRGHARALRNFSDFACYVTMFPQLVAGPIIRFSEVAEQMRQRTHTLEKFARGIAFIAMGLAKKILIANTCGKLADVAFGAGSIGFVDAWYGVVSYAFQIYFDFSAYSDMAIGLGLLLGFVFPKNFDSPYHAQSITEFWRRWHISLSSWLRDYLYIPLGGSRKGALRTYVNLALVMLLGGLWHGASWNFVIWGGIHGTLLGVERAQGKDSLYRRLPAAVRVAITFLIVCIAWVFFRATDLPDALAYLGSMFGVTSPAETAPLLSGLLYKPYYVATFAVAAAITWGAPQTWDWTRALPWWKIALIMVLFACSILVLATQSYNPFIYFIF